MRHVIMTRSAYGAAWSLEANRRRLEMTVGVTIASLRSQTTRDFEWIVLLDPCDELLSERRAAFEQAGARFLYLAPVDNPTPPRVAAFGYRADWGGVIGSRDGMVAMTRLDDDDGFAPWAMASVRRAAEQARQRVALIFPLGIRVWNGSYTLVRHDSNAMQTLVTPPDDAATVYSYLHRRVREFARVRRIDPRPAWLWSRHADTISGWRMADRPLTPDIEAMFDVDWRLFGSPPVVRRRQAPVMGRMFR